MHVGDLFGKSRILFLFSSIFFFFFQKTLPKWLSFHGKGTSNTFNLVFLKKQKTKNYEKVSGTVTVLLTLPTLVHFSTALPGGHWGIWNQIYSWPFCFFWLLPWLAPLYWNEKVDSVWDSTLLQIWITWENASNNAYFWQHRLPNWIYFPIFVNYNVSKISIFQAP